MPLLFDLTQSVESFAGMDGGYIVTDPGVAPVHLEQVMARLDQLGLSVTSCPDWPAVVHSMDQSTAPAKTVIVLRNDNELNATSLRMVEQCEPDKLYLISVFDCVFDVKDFDFKRHRAEERALSLPFSLYTNVEERSFLHTLAKECTAPGVILEIGTRYGGSLVPLVYGNRENPAPTKVFSVDCSYHDYTAEYLKRAGVDTEVLTYEMPSYRLGRVWEQASTPFGGPGIRLLWIDGDHTYLGLKSDFKSFVPYLSEGGILVVHDYQPTLPSIIKVLWEELHDFPELGEVSLANGRFFAVKTGPRRLAEKAVSFPRLVKSPNSPTDALLWLSQSLDYRDKRIALCGGGCHTGELLSFSEAFFNPFYQAIRAIVDDNPKCHCADGEKPIVPFDGLGEMDFDWVITSSYDHEAALVDRLIDSGVERARIITLYNNPSFVESVTGSRFLSELFQHVNAPQEIEKFKG